ncbi:MAG: tetraacyldisaccharide 4'-kinase [Ignavibacteriae bacterium]|nr:MAG: tetraacyldisaccharide 4'-kinase [Ignavibacteriota bacterium]
MKILRIILSPFSFIYRFIINIRNYLFDKNYFTKTYVNAKVISVGNLTVGGSGKTPLVMHLTNYLKNRGKKVGVLSRGYGRKSNGYILTSKENEILSDVNQAGDEIILVAQECNVATAVSEKRVDGAKKFLTDVNLDTIILDDGFQHRWIGKNFDILMIEQRFLSNVNSFDQSLLPTGSMREPFDAISRADVVVINRKFSPKITIPLKVKKYMMDKPIYYTYYKVKDICDVKNNKSYDTKEFEGQNSLVVCGIAKPFSFLRSLTENNINIHNKLCYKDHKSYTIKEVEEIRKTFYDTNSHSVLTTHKDAVKLMNYSKELDDIDIYYLKIELEFEEAKSFYELLNSKLY